MSRIVVMNTLHEESSFCQGREAFRLELKSGSRNELLAPVLLYVKNECQYGHEPKVEQ